MQSFHHRNTCVNVVDVYYEPVKNKNSPTSLANLSSVKTYEPKRKQLYPLVKSLSGGGIIISPVGLNKKTNYYGNGNGSFRMISKNNENKSNFNDRETPIFDVDLSGNDYKVKFMPIILDSVEHLTADLY